jgi:hypothetical protein
VTSCPVLTLTPHVRAMHDLFRRTHEVRTGEGHPVFTRVSLPRQGGLQDQDAREMLAIEVITDTTRQILREQAIEQERARRLKQEQGERRSARARPVRGGRRG